MMASSSSGPAGSKEGRWILVDRRKSKKVEANHGKDVNVGGMDPSLEVAKVNAKGTGWQGVRSVNPRGGKSDARKVFDRRSQRPAVDIKINPQAVASSWLDVCLNRKKIAESLAMKFVSPVISEGEPAVALLQEDMLIEVADRWESALIGYVLGDVPFFGQIRAWALRTWKKPGLSVFARANGFYFFQFQSKADRDEVLHDGPWMFDGRLVVLQRWMPNVVFDRDMLSSAPIWVRFPNLPLHLWSLRILNALASVLGQPISLDRATALRERLSFARCLVDISADCPLPEFVTVQIEGGSKFKVDVSYEGEPPRCEFCKCFGHLSSKCARDMKMKGPLQPADGLEGDGAQGVHACNQSASPMSKGDEFHAAGQVCFPSVGTSVSCVQDISGICKLNGKEGSGDDVVARTTGSVKRGNVDVNPMSKGDVINVDERGCRSEVDVRSCVQDGSNVCSSSKKLVGSDDGVDGSLGEDGKGGSTGHAAVDVSASVLVEPSTVCTVCGCSKAKCDIVGCDVQNSDVKGSVEPRMACGGLGGMCGSPACHSCNMEGGRDHHSDTAKMVASQPHVSMLWDTHPTVSSVPPFGDSGILPLSANLLIDDNPSFNASKSLRPFGDIVESPPFRLHSPPQRLNDISPTSPVLQTPLSSPVFLSETLGLFSVLKDDGCLGSDPVGLSKEFVIDKVLGNDTGQRDNRENGSMGLIESGSVEQGFQFGKQFLSGHEVDKAESFVYTKVNESWLLEQEDAKQSSVKTKKASASMVGARKSARFVGGSGPTPPIRFRK